jgi:hypothetical protein
LLSYRANRTEQEYNLGRAQPRDQDVRRRERLVRFWRQRLGVILAGLIIIICVLDILHLSANPKIVVLSSSTNQSFLRSTDIYQQAASKLFASSILNGNKITVNTAAVQQKLQQQFPELSDVSITLPLINHRPIVYISPTAPSMLLTTNGQTYALSAGGTVLLAADQLSTAVRQALPVVVDQTNQQVATGHEALPSSTISFIQTVVAELTAKSVATDSLTLPNTAAYELDVHPTGAGYFVKFNLHDSTTARQQAGTYLAVRDRLSSQGITPASYIDVRLVGRAYYK